MQQRNHPTTHPTLNVLPDILSVRLDSSESNVSAIRANKLRRASRVDLVDIRLVTRASSEALVVEYKGADGIRSCLSGVLFAIY